ncbi:hypothetical protein V8D89_005519 [Ganoderma adspersum]
MVLCELAVGFFFLLSLGIPSDVAAAAIPHSVLLELSATRNAIAIAQEHTSWPLDIGPTGLPPQAAEVFIHSDTRTFSISTPGTREAEGPPSQQYLSSFTTVTVTGLVVRQTATGDPSLPTATDTPSSTAIQTTTFSQPRADPSVTFSDPFPPDPLPTEDVEPIPPAPSVPETQTGVPTWAWGLGGAGIGLAVLLGFTRLLVFCLRKPQSE